MSKKLAYIISAGLFAVLCALLFLEKFYPEMGSGLLGWFLYEY